MVVDWAVAVRCCYHDGSLIDRSMKKCLLERMVVVVVMMKVMVEVATTTTTMTMS